MDGLRDRATAWPENTWPLNGWQWNDRWLALTLTEAGIRLPGHAPQGFLQPGRSDLQPPGQLKGRAPGGAGSLSAHGWAVHRNPPPNHPAAGESRLHRHREGDCHTALP